ncbi:MAG: Na/Pi symporter [Cytophagales bacterium]
MKIARFKNFKYGNSLSHAQLIGKIVLIIFILFIFLFSINLMEMSFKEFGGPFAKHIISATSNPFVSLFIGLLATAIIQSSSTTTSMVVALVASGTLSFEGAIPMVMGANIGTSLTSTIVSLGHITKKNQFKRAIAAATAHDFFNIFVTIILFPLEMSFKILSKGALFLTSNIYSEEGSRISLGIIFTLLQAMSNFVISITEGFGIVLVILSFVLLFISLRIFSFLIRSFFIGERQGQFEKYFFGNSLKSLLWGTGITAVVQSSSLTTSITVPLVATKKVSLEKAFPFLMGANIGTTVTALLAAISKSEAALDIALVHLIFNILGVLIFYPFPALRNIPIFIAKRLGNATVKYRLVGFGYIIVTFFLIPFLLIYFSGIIILK